VNIQAEIYYLLMVLICFVVTTLAFLLGRKLSGLVGKRAEIIGGIVLIAIGVKILLEHTL